ncbi:MAG: efflux RND transporter periplasmic adaptor subunit [Candidatus Cloacimonetes bacterium]|nr:efflux RND transporter periplasmic adaptor subunit [Candidatus Cloacimonadota bacterium]
MITQSIFLLFFTLLSAFGNEAPHTPETVWTCSMHPQIRMPDNKDKCPICHMDLIPLNQSLQLGKQFMTLNPALQSRIRTEAVSFGTVTALRHLRAKIVPKDSMLFVHAIKSAGRIENLQISRAGSMVETGDFLYHLYSPALITAQSDYLEAQKLQGEFGEKQKKDSETRLIWLGFPKSELIPLIQKNHPLELVPIYAELSGIVMEVHQKSGASGQLGAPVLTILKDSKTQVETYLGERDFVELEGVKQANFLPFGQAREIPVNNPVVEKIALGPSSTFRQIWELPESEPVSLEGHLIVKLESKPGLSISNTSLLFAGTQALVYEVLDNLIEAKMVKILFHGETRSIVSGNITTSSILVSDGAFVIDSEFQIQGKISLISSINSHRFGMNSRISPEKILSKEEKEFKESAIHLLPEYLNLWESLHNDDLSQSRHNLENTLKHLKSMTGEHARHLSLSLTDTEQTLETIRARFYLFSEWMVRAFKMGLFKGHKISLAFCPMAGKDGSYWLQKGGTLLNPYYGSSMLHCGNFEEVSD